MTEVAQFFAYARERHSIYRRRLSGQSKPWTDDPILQSYRFCNIYRELDTVTIHQRTQWREPYADHRNLWFALCLYRQITWPPTLDKIGFLKEWEPDLVLDTLRAIRVKGDKVYTGAYMIGGGIKSGRDKPFFTVYDIMQPLWESRSTIDEYLAGVPTLEGFVALLSQFWGWSGFHAYEVACDLRWTRYLRNAPDITTWANMGPGAARGLNRIFGRDINYPLSQTQALDEMQWILELSEDPEFWPNTEEFPPWELREVEHTLCEVDKYQRVLLGEGRPRSTYPGA